VKGGIQNSFALQFFKNLKKYALFFGKPKREMKKLGLAFSLRALRSFPSERTR